MCVCVCVCVCVFVAATNFILFSLSINRSVISSIKMVKTGVKRGKKSKRRDTFTYNKLESESFDLFC